jgi:WD40 repeat protein
MDTEAPVSSPRRARWRLRFSLLTLVLFVLVVGSGMGVWFRWEPWVVERTLAGRSGLVWQECRSPDGRRIVSVSRDATPRVRDAETGRELVVLKGHTEVVTSAVFSRDGVRILTASYDGTARVWDVETGRELTALSSHGGVATAAFSPDDHHVVTAGWNGTARLWYRRRPEYWWGVAWLPEFWTGIVFGLALAWSVRRDWRTLGRGGV